MKTRVKKVLKWLFVGKEYEDIPTDLLAQIFRYIVFLLCLAATFGFLLMFAMGVNNI